MSDFYINLVPGRDHTVLGADIRPSGAWANLHPLLMFGVDPIKPEVLEGQRNDKNGIYVDSLIAYFKRMEEKDEDQRKWISFYVEIKDHKVVQTVRFSSDFLKKMCSFFPFCKYMSGYKPLDILRLKVLGTYQVGVQGLGRTTPWENYITSFGMDFDLMEIFLEEERRHGAFLNDSITTRMIQTSSGSEKDIKFNFRISIGWFESSSIQSKNHSLMFSRLFDHEASKDFKLASENGIEINCHKNILMVQSDVITRMLSPDNQGMVELKSGKLEVKGLSDNGLSQFVRLLYGQEILISELSSELVLELMKTCHLYEMKEMLDILTTILLQRNYLWYTADSLVELFVLLTRAGFREDLRKYLLFCMNQLTGEIRNCEAYRELNPEERDELVWSLHEQLK